MPEPMPAHLAVNHARVRLGCGRSTIYELIACKLLRKVKLGRRTLIPADDVERLIRALQGGTLDLERPREKREGEAAKNDAHKERMRLRRAEDKTRRKQRAGEAT
jgi:excisionase family DNA binding protein